ncbi:hypothetical protein GU926_07585 [Nibribacter ruber]|uniref:Oligosaccharide flippase family protein n=1 Tax=Nibribacter ruber TaxID=2698458 RepID=A0A6P1NW66_9BACT|nr:hypothetical protein [Nibribacter ruber]QHL87300.1 hypothetical protein GU926_07585 [Nibribacter ruber]
MAQKRHIHQFLGGSLWSGMFTVVRALASLVVNKLFALAYGPSGITLLAHFQSLIAILTTLPNSGVNVGLIRYLAKGQPPESEYQSYFWAGLGLNFFSFFAVLGGLLLFPSFFFERFGMQEFLALHSWYWVAGVGLFLLVLVHLFCMSLLLARQALKAYVGLGLLASLLTMAITWATVGNMSLPLVLLLFLGAQAVTGVVATFVCFGKKLVPAWRSQFTKGTLPDLGKFVIMAVAMLVGGKLAEFLVRELAIRHFSLHETGMWQAVVKVSDSYTLVYTSVLGMVYYPRIAALLHQEAGELRKYVRTIFFTLLPLIAVGLGLVYVLRQYLLLLFFNDEFLPAQSLFTYQLLGDFLKMTAWVLSYVITVRAQVRLYVGIHLVSPAIYFLLVLWLLPLYGLQGLLWAYALDWGIFLLFHVWLFRSYFFAEKK